MAHPLIFALSPYHLFDLSSITTLCPLHLISQDNDTYPDPPSSLSIPPTLCLRHFTHPRTESRQHPNYWYLPVLNVITCTRKPLSPRRQGRHREALQLSVRVSTMVQVVLLLVFFGVFAVSAQAATSSAYRSSLGPQGGAGGCWRWRRVWGCWC